MNIPWFLLVNYLDGENHMISIIFGMFILVLNFPFIIFGFYLEVVNECLILDSPIEFSNSIFNCEKFRVLNTDNFGLTTLFECYNMVLRLSYLMNLFVK